MVKKIYFLVLFGCLSTIAFAQQKGVDSLIKWVNTHPKIDSLYILNLHRISYRSSETDVKLSFEYYEKVTAASDSLRFNYGKALAQINLGILLFNSANFEASNNAYFKAVDYAEQSNGLRLKAVCLNNIGENFKTLQDFDKCREYTHQAIEINTKLKAWRGVAVNYEQLQQCDLEEKKYTDAKKNLQTGLPFAQQAGENYLMSQYSVGFGKLQAVAGRYDSAKFYFTRALAEAKVENDLRNMYNVYLAEASFLKNISDSQKLKVLDSAMIIAGKTDYLKGVADVSEQLSLVYDGMGNKEASLLYFRKYRTASDSVFSENNRRNVIIKESEWMIKRKELENDHLKSITELQSKELKFKNGLLLAGIIALLLALAVGILGYMSIQGKKRQADAIQKQQEAELKNHLTDLEFKAFKAQLNPHFIFNYLNSISGYILLSQPEKASDMIKKFSRMLRTVLQNSEQNVVPLSDDIVTIEQYLELMHEIATPPFTYNVEADEAVKKPGAMVPPLFIQPYVENAILHGIKQSEGTDLFVRVTYRKNGNALEVSITDNGTGFDSARMKKNLLVNTGRIHLGLSVTEKRIQVFSEKNQYKASIDFTSAFPGTAQPGTKVTVVIDGYFG
ncbi:MAG: histidine kinase [Chitinophagaceae bacterium]